MLYYIDTYIFIVLITYHLKKNFSAFFTLHYYDFVNIFELKIS